MKTRQLTVYYGYDRRTYYRHPVIRLGGKYLSYEDFKIGDKVEVILEPGRITISKIPAEIKNNA